MTGGISYRRKHQDVTTLVVNTMMSVLRRDTGMATGRGTATGKAIRGIHRALIRETMGGEMTATVVETAGLQSQLVFTATRCILDLEEEGTTRFS